MNITRKKLYNKLDNCMDYTTILGRYGNNYILVYKNKVEFYKRLHYPYSSNDFYKLVNTTNKVEKFRKQLKIDRKNKHKQVENWSSKFVKLDY